MGGSPVTMAPPPGEHGGDGERLAAALGIDPLIIRLKNIPPNNLVTASHDPTAWIGQRNTIYRTELDLAVKEFELIRAQIAALLAVSACEV